MSIYRARIAKLEKERDRNHRFAGSNPNNHASQFLDASNRGLVLCRDGKERTVEQWIATLSPDLQTNIALLNKQGEE